jgi:hypothetical protein
VINNQLIRIILIILDVLLKTVGFERMNVSGDLWKAFELFLCHLLSNMLFARSCEDVGGSGYSCSVTVEFS